MTPKQWFAVGALASMPFALAAQQAPGRPDPLDANAAVPAESYKSAFDKVWRMANEAVAKPNAHTGHGVQTADGSPPAKAHAVDHSKHH